MAVGCWYRNFSQVADDEVRHLLAQARAQSDGTRGVHDEVR